MMQAAWQQYTLNFKTPAGTSRGVMQSRPVWYLFLTENNVTGIGECAPLAGLSLDNFLKLENKLDEVCQQPQDFLNNPSQLDWFPAIQCALEMANNDLANGGKGLYFHSPLETGESVNINGLIWMGDKDFMLSQIREKLETGWSCIKIKIGGLDFTSELEILSSLRKQFSADTLELRLDANGAFTQANVDDRLSQLAQFKPHSIEQPVAAGQFDLLARLCKSSPIAIALDEELIPLISRSQREQMLDQVQPQYLVLKPGLLGGFAKSEQWMALAKQRGINYWITSALESSLGLQAISQWTAGQGLSGYQGLGTGQLFDNNLPSSLQVKSGKLTQQTSTIWQDIHQFYAQWLHPKKTICLQTSGSTGKPKLMQMDKSRMRASAQLTAKTFKLKAGDRALLCLPVNYIAGKMMLVRALVLQLDLVVIQPSSLSSLSTLSSAVLDKPVKFAAMTPMQLENLLRQANNILNKIDTLIIGGASVSQDLLKRLRALSITLHMTPHINTKFFETYGMTETVSHVAIRALNSKQQTKYFHALSGVSFEQDQRGCLVIRAEHLGEDSIVSNDLVELEDNLSFKWLGRVDRVINSGGVKIIPEQVEEKLADAFSEYCFFVCGMADETLGEKVILVIEGEPVDLPEEIFKSLHRYEKPKEIFFIKEFQRTESGKLVREIAS